MNTRERKRRRNADNCNNMSNDIVEKYGKFVNKWVGYYRDLHCTNAVCDIEDLRQEAYLAAYIAEMTYQKNHNTCLNTWVTLNIKNRVIEYIKQNYHCLSGGAYLVQGLRSIKQECGADELPENFIELLVEKGYSEKTAVAATYFRLRPSQYGEQFDMADPKQDLDRLSIWDFNYREHLTEKEIYIIENYYGLNGCEPKHMWEIGKELNASRKSISYQINKIIIKLRKVPGIEEYAARTY